ncbi:O-antigen ligase family protein [Rhizobium sp. WYJ-E13]|uniref:O-antigen ligase family protein n=1 Tax=unclassified Rhizobium TaxID=2613769 RepID=UPI0020A71A4D|nr:O-antigen ligase family protein [Rhizobium sp. WYJ-E13]
MSIDTPYHNSSQMIARRGAAISRFAIRKELFVYILLSAMFYIALWRGTGMWYGLPANFNDGSTGNILPHQIILYSLIPLIAVYSLIEPHRFIAYLRRIPPLLTIIIVLCLASAAQSVQLSASLKGMVAVTVLTLPPLLFRLRYGSVETLRLARNFCIVAIFANVLYTFAFPQFAIMSGNDYDGMVKGLFYHKNELGQFCAIAFIIILDMKSPLRRLSYEMLIRNAALLLTVLLVVLARSSTAIVMIGVGTSMLVGLRAISAVGNITVKSLFVLLFCILLGLLGSLAYLGVAEAIASAFGKDLTFSGRSNIWDQLLPLVYERPFLGYGFSTFRQPDIVKEYVHVTFEAKSTHNSYLELALSIGVPATVLWTVYVLSRVYLKTVMTQSTIQMRAAQSKEAVILFLIAIGGLTEAAMMLSPSLVWPIMVASLPLTCSPIILKTKRR